MQGKPQITVPVIGLNKDNSVLKKPEGTYTFALNAVNEGMTGQLGTISSEPSTELCYTLPLGYILIGHVNLNAESTVVFSTNGSLSEIGLVENCSYKTLINEECLNFSDNYPIKGTARLKNGCDRIIYFHDANNEDRALNIDAIDSYYNSDGTIFYCNRLALSPSFNIPSVEVTDVSDNGGNSLKAGAYRFAIAYGSDNTRLTNYITISDLSRLYASSASSSIFNIEGSMPDTVTNKAIQLNISDIDESFDELIISVIVHDTGDGVTATAYQLRSIPITATSIDYLFTGIDINTSTVISAEDVLIDRIRYTKSKAMMQLDNRLIRANLENEDIDWGSFQQAANTVTSKYIVQTSNIFEPNDNHSSVKWNYSQDFQSYMGDEIYAFGIVWEFDDGLESPVFHIPGRPKDDPRINIAASTADDTVINYNRAIATTNWDSEQYVLDGTSVRNVEHRGFQIGDTVERWQLTNTAVKDFLGFRSSTTTDETIIQSGYMAYHENVATYPSIIGCNGKPIYPHTENADGTFTMLNVRHHRFPDRDYVPLVANTLGAPPSVSIDPEQTTAYHLGINFENINPPAAYADRVVGYRIVRGDRDQNNRTVLEKGLMYSAMSYEVDNELHFAQPSKLNAIYDYKDDNTNNDSYLPIQGGNAEDEFRCRDYSTSEPVSAAKVYVLHTADSKFNEGLSSIPTNIKYENKYAGIVLTDSTKVNGNPDFLHISGLYLDSNRFLDDPTQNHSSSIVDVKYMGFNSRGSIFSNSSTTFSTVDNSSQQPCIYVSVDAGVNYTDTGTETVNDQIIATYASLKNENIDVWADPASIKYVRTTQKKFIDSSADIYGGDIYLTPMGDRHTMNGITCRTFVGISTAKRALIRNIIMFMTESEIDTNLRNSDTTDCGSYFPLAAYTSSAPIYSNVIEDEEYQSYSLFSLFGISDVYWHAFKEYGYLDADSLPRPLCPNYYSYNYDYSLTNGWKVYFGLQNSYDCTTCSELFPNRVVWSQVDNGQSASDNYLINLANDFIEVPTNSGPITNIFSEKSRDMYIQTFSSLFKVFPTNQELRTADEVVQLGSGQFMGTPAIEISTIPSGYGGNKGRFNLIRSEHGIFWVDESNLCIYKLSDTLQPISEIGMSSWFEENMNFKIDALYQQYTGQPYTIRDNPFKRFGIGYSSTYDPKLERIIFVKKDYDIELLNLVTRPITSTTEGAFDGPTTIKFNYIGDDYFFEHRISSSTVSNVNVSGNAIFTLLEFTALRDSNYSITGDAVTTGAISGDVELFLEINGVIQPVGIELQNNLYRVTQQIDVNEGDIIKLQIRSISNGSFTVTNSDLDIVDNLYIPPLTVADPNDVKDKGWTISYSIRNNTWTSFHSYRPAYLYNDGKFFYSTKLGNEIHKHHSYNCGTFYGRRYPHMVEFVLADINTFYPESLKIVSKMWDWDIDNEDWYENELETYNYLWVRSSNLSTGNKNIIVQLSNDYSTVNNTTDIIAVKKYEEWNLSKIRNNKVDGSVGASLTTNQGIEYDTYFFPDGQGYIDIVPNQATIDAAKSLYRKDYITDKYCYVRLGLTSDTNSRITLDLVATKKILKQNA